MHTRGERGIGRILEKLEASIKNKQYYEAHQMYRTLYFRYLAHKKYEDLLNLLFDGSSLLLTNEQQTSGADLAILLIDVLTTSKISPSEEWIEKVAKLFEMIHDSIPERDVFLTKAVKWSMGDTAKGHPLLHKKIAQVFWSEKKYSLAHKHFLHSQDGSTFASMLIELHTTQGLPNEVDLFLAQAVFRLLCLKNIETANQTFETYINLHPHLKYNQEKPPYPRPLFDFLWYLMRAIEQNKKDEFQNRRTEFHSQLMRDPNYTTYLNNIGRIWFGIVNAKDKKPGGLLDGLLKSLAVESESSDDDVQMRNQNAPAPDLD